MKYIFSTYIFTAFFLLAFTACQNDESGTADQSRQAVRLSFAVDGVKVSPSRGTVPDDYYTSDNLGKVAIILQQTSGVADHAPSAPSYNYAPAQWSKNSEGTWGAVDADAANVLLWKTGSATDTHEVLRFIAYAPHDTDKVTTEGNYDNFSVAADQTLAADRLASDLVFYEAQAGNDGKITVAPATAISLAHKMCRLSVTLTTRNEFGSNGVSVSTVSVKGVLPSHSQGAAATTIFSDETETILGEKSTSRAFIFAQGEQTLTLEMKATNLLTGQSHTYTLPLAKKTFSAGTQYNLTVYLGKDKVELSKDGITITPWTKWEPQNGEENLETD